jgi:type IV pilus assembly protein PilQ
VVRTSAFEVTFSARLPGSWALRMLLFPLLLVIGAGAAIAQELANLRWLENETGVFAVNGPGDLDFTTEVLDNGYRLRVSFPGANLAGNIRDIGESGIVRGVFPYETDAPDRANFDILLKSVGTLQVFASGEGYRIAVVEGSGESDPVADAAPVGETTQVPIASESVAQSDTGAVRDPGPYDGLSELERTVLEEIEASNRASDVDVQPTPGSTPTEGDSARARVVLSPTSGSPTATEQEDLSRTDAETVPTAPQTSQVADVDLPVQRAEQPVEVPAPPAVTATESGDLVRTDVEAAEAAPAAPRPPEQVADVEMPVQRAEQPMEVSAPPAVTDATSTGPALESPPVMADTMPVESAPAAPQASGEFTGQATRLNAITYSQLPGGRLQVNFNLVGQLDEPGVFRTNQPPRIVLDFFGASNAVMEDIQRVGFGALESIVTAETDDRTRVILNLVAPVEFEQRRIDNGLVLVMASPSDSQMATATRARPVFEGVTDRALQFSLADVDFRRTPDGGGQITVKLNSPEIGVDVREEAGEIVVDFPATDLPAVLEKRLDVTDFATPVQTIDTFFAGAGARMIISPVGQYSYSSYQVGDTLTVQVSPVTISEDEREPDEFGYVGERLSFNFQRISVRAALQVIADFTGLNFVTSDSVTGDLSLRLQDVPWDQALDTILQVKGLAQRQRGNVVWVAPAEEIASKERQALEALNQVSDLEPLVSELIQINYAKAEDIATILKSVRAVDTGLQSSLFGNVTVSEIETESNSLLSSRGNVTVDPRTNTLLVQDTRSKIREIRTLIAQLDRPVRQVLIETRIVEANDDFSRNIGARLGFTRVTENARFPGVSDSNLGTAIGSASLEDNNLVINSGNVADRGGFSVDLGADGTGTNNAASYAFTLAKAGAGFAHLIDLEISALEAEGTGKVIANPRLMTTDQNEARIEQGQERVFTTSVLGEGGVVTKKAVLGLTVTPQITPDDRLVLDVFVTKDSFTAADDATINTKQIRTKVLLDNGETVVIGGIYEQAQSESTTKVPLLGDIPGVGALFRKRNRFDNRTELLIFLTPRILDPTLTVNR